MKKYLLSGIIGLLLLPTITFGSIFVSSLVSGKTPEEAIQILAEQLDILIPRIERVEQNVSTQNVINQNQEIIIQEQQALIDKLQSNNSQLETELNGQEQTITNQQQIISGLNTKQTQQASDIQKRQEENLLDAKCSKLKQITPQIGRIDYMNKDIVKFYEMYKIPKDDFDQQVASEAKPLYNIYISQCASYEAKN